MEEEEEKIPQLGTTIHTFHVSHDGGKHLESIWVDLENEPSRGYVDRDLRLRARKYKTEENQTWYND